MARKETTVAAGMKMKPRLSFDLPGDANLPRVGETITVTVSGKVVSTAEDKRHWEPGKPVVRSVSIEYGGPQAVHMAEGKGGDWRAKLDKAGPEERRRFKKDHPDRYREYLGGSRNG